MEWVILTSLGVMQQIEELFFVRITEENVVFETQAWQRVLSLRRRVYREMCLEMFCSMSVDEDWTEMDVMTKEVIHFRLGGEMRHCTLPQFGVWTGIFRETDLELPGFVEYMKQGETHFSNTEGFDADVYWQELTGLEGRFSRTLSKAASIRDPVLRIVHKLLVHSFFHRSTHHDKVYMQELWALWIFQHHSEGRFMNLPWVLAVHLETCGAGSRSDSQICGGHFVTRIMRALGIFTEETLEGCSAPVPMVTINLHDLRAWKLLDSGGRLIGQREPPQQPRPLPQPLPAPRVLPTPPPRDDSPSSPDRLARLEALLGSLGSHMAALVYDARRYQPLLESLLQEHAQVAGTVLPAYEPPQVIPFDEPVITDDPGTAAETPANAPATAPAVDSDIGPTV